MLTTTYNGNEFKIIPDNPDVGVYLYVYDDGRCVRDELQNDVETCKEIAFEDYGVPKDVWRKDQSKSAELS